MGAVLSCIISIGLLWQNSLICVPPHMVISQACLNPDASQRGRVENIWQLDESHVELAEHIFAGRKRGVNCALGDVIASSAQAGFGAQNAAQAAAQSSAASAATGATTPLAPATSVPTTVNPPFTQAPKLVPPPYTVTSPAPGDSTSSEPQLRGIAQPSPSTVLSPSLSSPPISSPPLSSPSLSSPSLSSPPISSPPLSSPSLSSPSVSSPSVSSPSLSSPSVSPPSALSQTNVASPVVPASTAKIESYFQLTGGRPATLTPVHTKPNDRSQKTFSAKRALWHILDNAGVPMFGGNNDADVDPRISRNYVDPLLPDMNLRAGQGKGKAIATPDMRTFATDSVPGSGTQLTPHKIPEGQLEGTDLPTPDVHQTQ